VLILDDSPFVLALTRTALEEAGFSVLVATDVTELEHQRRSMEPDLILVDVQMPEAFGDDIAMTLREIRGVHTPILLLSNVDDAELARRAIQADIEGYISKRDGLGALVDRVVEIIGPGGGAPRA
jgi:DNA-binding NarL/FixJ family response regulator